MEVYLPLSNLAKRLLTGVVLVVLIVGATQAGSLGFLLLLLLVNGMGLAEFYRLFHTAGLEPRTWGGVVLSSYWLISLHGVLMGWFHWTLLLVGIPIAFLIVVAELYRKAVYPIHNLAFTSMGVSGITLPLLFFQATAFLPFHEGSYHPQLMLGYFCILWAADSGAFFTGKAFGRHKLFKRISPGKTWEGSVGGALAALVVALVAAWFIEDITLTEWLVMTGIILVTGTYGDLIKSMMKRSLHIKDSGTILPGHGGILDRFDTLLGSAPFVFLYLLIYSYA